MEPPRRGRFVQAFRQTGGRRRRRIRHPSELSKGSAAGRDEVASSGAATTHDGNCDDDDAEVELLEAESARKKIEALAAMVGMEGSSGAGAVLREVVKVLRELEKKAEHVQWRSRELKKDDQEEEE
ncbi:uncharacterized protein LOC122003592 [Zingiber officinale]|uniref:uncharacterized protein LOC122003592 n=1 Tax=Zingiber officinale TaxID=94328 RepID=UPI001C4C7675|nr:uncharacterized protein LOC122003592 [Zingiber officinale]